MATNITPNTNINTYAYHRTLHPHTRGYIDIKPTTTGTGKNVCRGWCFHQIAGVLPIRLIQTGVGAEPHSSAIITQTRSDVAGFYGTPSISECGFMFTIEEAGEYILQIQITEGEWHPVFKWTIRNEAHVTPDFSVTLRKIPSFVVIDNFYKEPNSVREFALSQDFIEHPSYHKGRRTDICYRFPGLKERFEEILGTRVLNWDKYGTNGCFQYCIAGDQLVYHQDTQEYAGVLFLTPDAPPDTGTKFFRSKLTKRMTAPIGSPEYNAVFKGGFLDRTAFDEVDVVGNVYNRLVLFDSHMIHAASEYFGTTKESGRLFQLFFFDIERPASE